ncbi:hypothetical protein A7K94_0201115 [Modestobacter sp. VKM Ac-2676]|nr:hypothetical protein A7K94_0201115 [Modestobacter sp. VKM Ac-2676]
MQLREVLRVIRDSWLIIVATVAVALVAGWAVTAIAPARYETETMVLVSPTLPAGSDANVVQAATLVNEQVATYAALAETPSVLDPAIESSGVDVASTELVDDVAAEVVPQTSLILLTVEAGSGQDAAELANAISASLIEQIEGPGVGVDAAVGAVGATGTVVAAPEIPTNPSSPDLLVNLLVALAVGLVVSFLVIVFQQALAAAPRGR